MRNAKSLIMAMVGALLALALIPAAFAQSGNAMVRVVHASPDAPAVDVWINGSKVDALTNVPFFTASGYLPLPAGSYDILVVPAGQTTPAVIDAKGVKIEAGKAYTIAATGLLANIAPAIYADNLATPAAGKAHVRIIHASPDAPAVDVRVAGGPALFSNLAFPNASDYLPVDAGTYNLEVTPAGSTTVVLPINGVTLEAGKIYDVFAVGELANLRVEPVVTTPMAAAAAPAALPRTGGETSSVALFALAAAALIGGGVMLRRRA